MTDLEHFEDMEYIWTELQKVDILVSRIPDISIRKSGHFQKVATNHSIFGRKKDTIMLIYATFQLQMTVNGQKTRLCILLCLIMQQSSPKTWFGHFSVENPDTGQK